jgi:hypothetical protein
VNRRGSQRKKTGRRSGPVKESPYMHLWPELAHMPALSHWPDRPEPYTPERSQVLAWLAEGYRCGLDEAERILHSAKHKGVIRYNSETRLWCGMKGGRP